MQSFSHTRRSVLRRMSSGLTVFAKKLFISLSAVSLTAAFLSSPLLPVVHAASAFTADEIVRSHHAIKMKPGGEITFEIHFKNTGSSTWKNSGSNFVALATVDPEKRESSFQHPFWPDEHYRPAYLLQPSVAPGETGFFRFALKAPEAVGEYKETFQAVAKNLAWIQGSRFTIPITVTNETNSKPAEQVATYSIDQDYPVRDAAYSAEWKAGSQEVIYGKPGEQKLVNLFVKNTGSKTWSNEGARYISAYTVRPNYHASVFYSEGQGWKSTSQIAMDSTSVPPGASASFQVLLQMPSETGEYQEQIRLAAEEYSWMKNGELHLNIHVSNDAEQKPEPTEESQSETTVYKDEGYQAKFLISSGSSVQLKAGETTTFKVGFKNTGSKTWVKSGGQFVSLYTVDPNYRASRFAQTRAASLNDGWLSNHQVSMQQESVAPGQLAFFEFSLTAPATAGSYTEKFRLAVEDVSWIQGGDLHLPIYVKDSTAISPPPSSPAVGNLGPIMRVGLTSQFTTFNIIADSPFELRTESGQLLSSLSANTEVQISYHSGTYSIVSAPYTNTLSESVIVQALDNSTIMEILSWNRPLPWNPAVNENLFRGSIQIKHSMATGKTWAVNILPMEQYLKGIAETSSESPVEFLKVMSVAARTYATYHYERQTKHADEHFYVDSQYDQVYKGYALEKRHPRLVEAVDATTGQVVTWTDPDTGDKKIAITPYFSQSDGRTRDWSEVWGGEVPWTKSVPVPHDAGKTLLGHGVGMSARGGLLMVVEDGATYDEVLHYFFTGIEIEDRY